MRRGVGLSAGDTHVSDGGVSCRFSPTQMVYDWECGHRSELTIFRFLIIYRHIVHLVGCRFSRQKHGPTVYSPEVSLSFVRTPMIAVAESADAKLIS